MDILDAKDKRIILELDHNARQSAASIAKKINISKETVNFRLKRLQKLGLIRGFSTIINVERLGYSYYNVFLQMQNATKEVEKQFIEYIDKNPNITWTVKTMGQYAFFICIMARSSNEFDKHLSALLSEFGKYINDYSLFLVTEAFRTPYKYLEEDPYQLYKIDDVKTEEEQVKLDAADLKLLQLLDKNPLMPLTEIARELKVTANTINYNIKKLLKQKVIQSFRPRIDCSKIGLQWFIALFKLNHAELKKQKTFINYLLHHKQIVYLVEGVGAWSMMIDIHTKDTQEMNNILNEIKNQFPNLIKSESIVMVPEVHKVRFCVG